MSPLKSVGKLLQSNNALGGLLAHTERLQRAQRLLHTHLPASLAQHCQVANIKEDMIVVHADSSAWAAKLRFHVAGMLAQLIQQQEFSSLRAVRIKVSRNTDTR
jgi:hypothetical protein